MIWREKILADVANDFRAKGLGSKELRDGYVGASIAALEVKYCAEESYSKVDFDLALKQLEEGKLVDTGPMEPYENTPGSQVVVIAIFSRRNRGEWPETQVVLQHEDRFIDMRGRAFTALANLGSAAFSGLSASSLRRHFARL